MMFLLTNLWQIAGVLLTLVILYQVFFSDYVQERIDHRKEEKENTSNANKIAQLKMVSDDPKDISKFITDNATVLSEKLVQSLVARIEYLRADQVITADNVLKRRIDELESPEETVAKRATRKR